MELALLPDDQLQARVTDKDQEKAVMNSRKWCFHLWEGENNNHISIEERNQGHDDDCNENIV